jgi:hypothetical protein
VSLGGRPRAALSERPEDDLSPDRELIVASSPPRITVRTLVAARAAAWRSSQLEGRAGQEVPPVLPLEMLERNGTRLDDAVWLGG